MKVKFFTGKQTQDAYCVSTNEVAAVRIVERRNGYYIECACEKHPTLANHAIEAIRSRTNWNSAEPCERGWTQAAIGNGHRHFYVTITKGTLREWKGSLSTC